MKRDDEHWMHKALGLARRGEGSTRPNPPVGAVIVRKGVVVGNGYHRKAGGPHAEITAFRSAGKRARGGTLYVTLEPCSTTGGTGACTDSIIAAGISRVVAAVPDPNPRHRGRGFRLLEKAGIEVVRDVLGDEGGRLIGPFSKWVEQGLPFVTLKMGMTVDGRIADHTGGSRWITCAESRKRVQKMRRKADAVLVGKRTVLRDNPSLLPDGKGGTGLYRVVADSSGGIPATAQLLNDGFASQTIVATTGRCPKRTRAAFEKKGAQVWRIPAARRKVSLRRLLRRLGKLGLLHVLCEGGGELARGLINAGLVDEYLFFVAPMILGGEGAVPVVGGADRRLVSASRLRFIDSEEVGEDMVIRMVNGDRNVHRTD